MPQLPVKNLSPQSKWVCVSILWRILARTGLITSNWSAKFIFSLIICSLSRSTVRILCTFSSRYCCLLINYNKGSAYIYGPKLNALNNKRPKLLPVGHIQLKTHRNDFFNCGSSRCLKFPNFYFHPTIAPLFWNSI